MPPTSIEWTDVTWNPVRGCSMAAGSEAGGCLNCYAARQAARNLPGMASPTTGRPFAVTKSSGPRWTGDVELIPYKLAEPLSWTKPRRCFVNSMSDLFHEELPFDDMAAVFGIMAACPNITFQALTKRPERALAFFEHRFGLESCEETVARKAESHACIIWDPRGSDVNLYSQVVTATEVKKRRPWPGWPLPNVWLGTSVENQETANLRVPILLECSASRRFVSYEPALDAVNLPWLRIAWQCSFCAGFFPDPYHKVCPRCSRALGWSGSHKFNPPQGQRGSGLDWIICGGESGPGARPMHPDWARSVRDQCQAAGVPFFFKQWGEWSPGYSEHGNDLPYDVIVNAKQHEWPQGHASFRVGKMAAGRLLDGQEWSEFPEEARA